MFPWIFLALLVPFHYALYKLFPKAGQPAWAALIPFYNMWVVQKKILQKPWYWNLYVGFLLLPGINLVMFGCFLYNLARAFGKYTSKELFNAVVLFPWYFIKIAKDPKAVFVPKEKRPARKKSTAREWGEALVFAIIAATFIKGYVVEPYKIPTSSMEDDLMVGDFLIVSKLNYGLKLPQTPLTFPFTHNNFYDLPLLRSFAKSYSTAWELPLLRLPALESIDRNEIVVFNFPANDTTIQTLKYHAHNYYVYLADTASVFMERGGGLDSNDISGSWNRYVDVGRKALHRIYPIVHHPIDKRNNYIKRCVGISGDKLEVRLGDLYVNDVLQERPKNSSFMYYILFNTSLNKSTFLKYHDKGISPEDMTWNSQSPYNLVEPKVPVLWKLTDSQRDMLKNSGFVDSIAKFIERPNIWSPSIYPNHPKFAWNKDNFGPVIIPKKGMSIKLDEHNFILYKRVIEAYENHKAEWKGEKAFIDGKEASDYTFSQNYYFMMGDNRHGSADSRFWGFVPNDHVVGKALLVVASTDDTGIKSFPNNIRWNRFFRLVH